LEIDRSRKSITKQKYKTNLKKDSNDYPLERCELEQKLSKSDMEYEMVLNNLRRHFFNFYEMGKMIVFILIFEIIILAIK
jgi:hypothetical protein